MSYKRGSPKTAKRLLIVCSVLVLVADVLSPLLVAAQTACGDYDCFDESEFDTDDPDHDGWVPANGGNSMDTDLGWLETKTFGALWWATSADGVLTASGTSPTIYKIVYLQPGTYRMVLRAGSDKVWGVIENTVFTRATPSGGVTFGTGSFILGDSFETLITDEFSVASPGDVIFELSGDSSATLYYDYIWIVASDTPTATPGPGTPTATTIPPSATPIATATPFCIAAPATPTPGPPQFELTPTPSPTPNPFTNWTVFDPFDYATLGDIWEVAGNGVYNSLNTGRGTSKPGAAFIPYSVDPPGWTYAEMEREALIWQPSPVISDTAYVDGWARTDFVPQGTSVYIEIWYLDTDTLLWSQAATTQVSASNWYNFHHAITPTLEIAAIAFLSSRDDDATDGGVYLDDVYIYNDLDNAPYCDGSYPPGTDRHGSGDPVGSEPTTTTTISIPANRACPPDLEVPNNFWGPLLAQLTLFLDSIFAFAPGHTPGSLTQQTTDLVASPVGTYTLLASVFFDLRIPATAASLILLLEGVRAIWSVWLLVKKSIPFL